MLLILFAVLTFFSPFVFGADTCKVGVGQGRSVDITRAKDLVSLFRVIGSVPTGRKVLDKFLPLYLSGKVKVEDLTHEEVMSFIEEGAMGRYMGAIKTLKLPIGIFSVSKLASSALHEMVHAIDHYEGRPKGEDVLVDDERCGSAEMLFWIEKHAFDAENKFLEELVAANKCFGEQDGFDGHKFKDLPPIDDAYILEKYGHKMSAYCRQRKAESIATGKLLEEMEKNTEISPLLNPNYYLKATTASPDRERDAEEFETQLKRISEMTSKMYSGSGTARFINKEVRSTR